MWTSVPTTTSTTRMRVAQNYHTDMEFFQKHATMLGLISAELNCFSLCCVCCSRHGKAAAEVDENAVVDFSKKDSDGSTETIPAGAAETINFGDNLCRIGLPNNQVRLI